MAARAMGAEVIAIYRHDHQGEAALRAGAARVVRDGETTVARRLDIALATGESLQLAVHPPPPPVEMTTEALPAALRDVHVSSASAADFDALLRGAA